MVDGEAFVWHYDACCPWCSSDVFTAGKEGCSFVLFIDPYPWEFELRPANVAAAIRWGRSHGWSAESGPTRALSFDATRSDFVWLDAGQRHLACDES